MPKVPDSPKPPKQSETKAIYCFPPGTSEADKQHDIAEIDKFIEYVKAQRAKKSTRPPRS